MATVLDRLPLDAIEAQAREITFARTVRAMVRAVLVVLAAAFFAVGWLAFQPWKAVTWCAAAAKVGWKQAQQTAVAGPPDGGG